MQALMVCLSVVAMFSAAPPASAQALETLDIANGEALAQRLSVNCHQIKPDATETMLSDVTGFSEVTNRPGMTAEKIEASVLSPHRAMPTIQFSREELTDISAYIMSLREREREPN